MAFIALRSIIVLLISTSLYNMGQIKTQALADLKLLLYSEKEWVKVHVAEFLIWKNQYVDEVRKVFLEEERQFGHVVQNLPVDLATLLIASSANENKYMLDAVVRVDFT